MYGRLKMSLLVITGMLALSAVPAAAQTDEVTAEQVLSALEDAYGVHPGAAPQSRQGNLRARLICRYARGGDILPIAGFLRAIDSDCRALLSGWRRSEGIRYGAQPAWHCTRVQVVRREPAALDHAQYICVFRGDAANVCR
jgi:hypothetical protein